MKRRQISLLDRLDQRSDGNSIKLNENDKPTTIPRDQKKIVGARLIRIIRAIDGPLEKRPLTDGFDNDQFSAVCEEGEMISASLLIERKALKWMYSCG